MMGERSGVLTASTLTLPASTWGLTAISGKNAASTCWPTRFCTAGGVPLKGTCTRSSPVRLFRITPMKCEVLPAVNEAKDTGRFAPWPIRRIP
jgi:hypothetical protein